MGRIPDNSGKRGRNCRLLSRNRLDYSNKYPAIVEIIRTIADDFILDGEVVVLDYEGKPDFDALQKIRLQKNSVLVYYVFDVLYYTNKSLINEPLIKRKKLLKKILPQHPQVRYTDHVFYSICLIRVGGKILHVLMDGTNLSLISAFSIVILSFWSASFSRSWGKACRADMADVLRFFKTDY